MQEGTLEGEICNRNGCDGTIEEIPENDLEGSGCYCHLGCEPCSYCTQGKHRCDTCDYVEDDA